MKGNSHNSISGVEGFLDAITMVDIDINVENALMIPRIQITIAMSQ